MESGEPANWDNVIRGLDNNAGLGRFAGPGGWNNMDFLAVGAPEAMHMPKRWPAICGLCQGPKEDLPCAAWTVAQGSRTLQSQAVEAAGAYWRRMLRRHADTSLAAGI